ncbi:response regulator transcription factor [Flintibacter faecis]|uniref:Stage 0 sporulation protein A homolog n=1 Tax=Flintibacter faecis TaxID=2763047 RepID=A0A8J6M157_9FIRM|nr:response regulator transcription factor [Flintibacter faecis]MBC5715949.1 response regulator transcription factor [Flintibacter faecis]
MAKILVVDDEAVLVKGIRFNLQQEGYQVETGSDGEQAVELAREGSFDLVILDLMMPKIDGLQACMRIREFSDVPIIMLTAKGEDSDKLMGFACGADDYVTKPFNILELKARVRALLRRTAAAAVKQQETGELTVGHIHLDPAERSAWKDGAPVELTAKEFDLMELLMRNPGRVYSRENLLNVVWGYEYVGDYRTVDVHIRRLREKLELDPANPEYIRTKWGVGYYLSSQKSS